MGRDHPITLNQTISLAEKALAEAYWDDATDAVAVAKLLEPSGRLAEMAASGQVVMELVSRRFRYLTTGDTTRELDPPARAVIRYRLPDLAGKKRLIEILSREKSLIGAPLQADVPFSSADVWCPGPGAEAVFGDIRDARRRIRAEALTQAGLTGRGVNVVIVDQGLDKAFLRREAGRHDVFGGGWPVRMPDGSLRKPGELVYVPRVTGNAHGMMVARALLAVAPGVTLWDLPILPPLILQLETWLSDAQAALERVIGRIESARAEEKAGRSDTPSAAWLLLNPWAVFDLRSESERGDWSTNPAHAFNLLIKSFVARGADVIFSAGNCGRFCPDRRCGPYDIGPGNSIHGSHALKEVVTVGAVTVDGRWVGASAQGPGRIEEEKPDLVAPSMFTPIDDRAFRMGGTSTAAAVTAGVVAALREAVPPSQLPPEQLAQHLRDTAWRHGRPRWDEKLGWGILNAEACLQRLR